jgi:CRP-like cAMP-binding protein
MAAPTREDLETREAEIQNLVKQEQRDEAKKILLDLIVSCARGGDIKNATRLRDMLYEVDPMALGEIIKVNEIIDEAMSGSIDKKFELAWSGLREALSDEEFLALYHALDMHEVGADKSIAKAGSKLDALFFITQGNVNVNYLRAGKNFTVTTLEPGSLIGDNCFQPSVWTVSLVSLTPVSLSVLRRKELAGLFDRFAGLENKLTGYYEQFDTIPQLFKDQEQQRREHERKKVDNKITFQIQGEDGKVAKHSFRGELDNISLGGLSFLMRIVNREKRRALFSRHLIITVQADNNELQFIGVVVAVTIHDFQDHDYAIHLAFDKPVPEEIILPLIPPEPEEDEDLPDQEAETDEGS